MEDCPVRTPQGVLLSKATADDARRKWVPRFGVRSLLVAVAVVALLVQLARTLDPRVQIHGRVIFADSGQPAADVRVHAQPVDRGEHYYYRAADCFTDKAGRFVLNGLPKGKYNVFVAAGNEWVATALDTFNATRRKTNAPALQLSKGALIKGQLIHAKTGESVAVGNSTVRVGMIGPSRPRSGAAIDSALVKPDGSFEIRAAPGENMFYLTAPGRFLSMGPFQLTSSQAGYLMVAEEGEVVSLDFKVAPRPSVRMPPSVEP